MRVGDVHKVRDVGFRVFKLDIVKKAIFENAGTGAWRLIDKYETKAEAEREWKALMENPKHIGD